MFAGYHGRKDLDGQVLVNVNGERCYRSGDYGRLDAKTGEVMFMGRRDFQIKLRGQRIELGHIEETIVGISESISNCIVMKYVHHEEEHLVAYVETVADGIDDEELRQKCLSHLSSCMIPSIFILLDRFPPSSNGKVDRKALPVPDFRAWKERATENREPMNLMERRVVQLWREILHIDQLPRNCPFFSLHGTSLSFMKLYSLYQLEFGKVQDIVTSLEQATIRQHAQLLAEADRSGSGIHYQSWLSLHTDQGKSTTTVYEAACYK